MHRDTTKEFADIAVEKIAYFKTNPGGYFISTMMAGAYVGVGIILILTLGNDADPSSRNLIMGCFFGIALALIIFAGAELFSGHVMFMTFGFLYKRIGLFTAIKDWIICWYGNLFGAVALSFLFALGGGGGWMDDRSSLLHSLADAKMNSSMMEIRGHPPIGMTCRSRSYISKRIPYSAPALCNHNARYSAKLRRTKILNAGASATLLNRMLALASPVCAHCPSLNAR